MFWAASNRLVENHRRMVQLGHTPGSTASTDQTRSSGLCTVIDPAASKSWLYCGTVDTKAFSAEVIGAPLAFCASEMTELPSTLKMKPFGSMCLEGSFMDMPHEGISCTLTGPALLFFKRFCAWSRQTSSPKESPSMSKSDPPPNPLALRSE